MTSNPYFVSYVERIQQHLASFTMTDDEARDFLRVSDPIERYNPRFLLFEILFNYRLKNGTTQRRFDPHVSDKVLDLQKKNFVTDLRRLYGNAERRGVKWEEVRWDTSEVKQYGVENMKEEMQILDRIYYDRVQHLAPNEQPNEQDIEDIDRILKKLLKRYEIEFLPTNFAANALIYEAWKLKKLFPLGNPEPDVEKFSQLLEALFIKTCQPDSADLMLDMARNFGLDHLTEINRSYLKNGDVWSREIYPEPSQGWFACVEQALINKQIGTQGETADRYLIHFPLLIDDYWFAGFAYLHTDWMRTDSSQPIPELFERSKYAKFYSAIQSVSETLRFSLRMDALARVEEHQENLDVDDIFLQAVKDYFACFNVYKTGENPEEKYDLVYRGHNVDIFGPTWLTQTHRDRIKDEIDGERNIVGYRVLGLYEAVRERIRDHAKIQIQRVNQGKEERDRLFAHQAAGLVAEVWSDSAKEDLHLNAKVCLWQLKSLIEIWGNFELRPEKDVSEEPGADFPEWETLPPSRVLQNLIEHGLRHALRRSTYARTPGNVRTKEMLEADNETVTQAVRLSELEHSTMAFAEAVFEQPVDQAIVWRDDCRPEWLRNRGFAICFHHAFWQAAHHAFRAKCSDQPAPFLQVEVTENQIVISNRDDQVIPPGETPRDTEFFNTLNNRMEGRICIQGPERRDDNFWYTTVTWKG